MDSPDQTTLNQLIPLALICAVFTVAILGFFWTKTPGFGKYNTCLLVLIMALFAAAAGYSIGTIETPDFANLLFAVAGYAGGLVSPKPES